MHSVLIFVDEILHDGKPLTTQFQRKERESHLSRECGSSSSEEVVEGEGLENRPLLRNIDSH